MNSRSFALIALGMLTTSLMISQYCSADASLKMHFEMTSDGELKQPTRYRKWVFVGAPVTPNERNNGKAPFPEIHSVYIDRDSWSHWKRTGEFRDGTVIIKELSEVGSTVAASGKGYFMGNYIGLEATIKSKKHFSREPGNWAYFSFTTPDHKSLTATAKAFPTAACNSCHAGAAADDFIFTQYYPVLRGESANVGYGGGGHSAAPVAKIASQWDPTAPTPSKSPSAVPLDKEKLFRFLDNKRYERFPAKQTGTHPGGGPHTKIGLPVRVVYNDILNNSFKAGNKEHPPGASVIKEMYTEDGL